MTNMTGIFIPIEILQDTNLSINEKIILSLVKNMKSLFMSNKTLSDLLGISKSRVSHIITELNKKGYVDVELTYTEEKQVEKRTVTLKKAVEAVQEVVKKMTSKAKELKQSVNVQEESKKPSATQNRGYMGYIKKDKKARFNNIASHNWDFNQLEQLEQEYVDNKSEEEFNLERLQERLKNRRNA